MLNFVRESKAFNDSIEDNDLAVGQIALWYALFHQNNKHNWAEWFPLKNSQLVSHTGLSVSGIHKARNVLKQKGYIDFKPQGRNQKTLYRLSILVEGDCYEDSNKQSNNHSNKQSNRGSNKQSATIYKHKQETINITNQSKLNARAREGSHIPIFNLGEEAKQDV